MPDLLGNETHAEELRREEAGRKQARGLERRRRTRITDAPVSGEFYYDQSGNVYGVKSYGGVELINDPWTNQYRARAQKDQMGSDLAQYDAEAMKYREDLLNLFGQRTELGAARQQRGVQSSLNQFLAQRGLYNSPELSASLAESTQGRLAGQVAQQQADFSSQLLQLMQQERDAFVRGSWDFARRIEAMGYANQLEMQLSQFQADLAKDLQNRNMFLGFLGEVGSWIYDLTPFGAASNVAGAAFGGGPGGRQADEYGYG